ncbi:carbohydrate ABC transporter permease [Zooshikella ganghwensis]|uniref:carbohydrate ABC transporter permease n=1 Tax=Zooshikella ganghwensis TaxID=202772 RepID=UPI00041CF8F4|nr:sugar ABC transporter permease [Zooshikella ganghwensis]
MSRISTGSWWQIVWLLLPVLVTLFAVAGWPLFRTIWFSFTDASLANLDHYTFVGLENYLVRYQNQWFGLLADSVWWNAVYNTLFFTVVSVAMETVLGVAIALTLHKTFPGRGWVRAAVLIPWAIPTIVSARMWSWMLHDQFGVINDLLILCGLISEPLAWTADPDLSMWAVILVDVWKTTPFMALLTLAALQMLPKELFEAAKVDGVSTIKTFWKVTLPLIAPGVMVAVVFRALDALRVFDLIYVLTANSTATMSMSVFARQQLVAFQLVGYGSAASTMLFMVIALCTVIFLYAGRHRFYQRF